MSNVFPRPTSVRSTSQAGDSEPPSSARKSSAMRFPSSAHSNHRKPSLAEQPDSNEVKAKDKEIKGTQETSESVPEDTSAVNQAKTNKKKKAGKTKKVKTKAKDKGTERKGRRFLFRPFFKKRISTKNSSSVIAGSSPNRIPTSKGFNLFGITGRALHQLKYNQSSSAEEVEKDPEGKVAASSISRKLSERPRFSISSRKQSASRKASSRIASNAYRRRYSQAPKLSLNVDGFGHLRMSQIGITEEALEAAPKKKRQASHYENIPNPHLIQEITESARELNRPKAAPPSAIEKKGSQPDSLPQSKHETKQDEKQDAEQEQSLEKKNEEKRDKIQEITLSDLRPILERLLTLSKYSTPIAEQYTQRHVHQDFRAGSQSQVLSDEEQDTFEEEEEVEEEEEEERDPKIVARRAEELLGRKLTAALEDARQSEIISKKRRRRDYPYRHKLQCDPGDWDEFHKEHTENTENNEENTTVSKSKANKEMELEMEMETEKEKENKTAVRKASSRHVSAGTTKPEMHFVSQPLLKPHEANPRPLRPHEAHPQPLNAKEEQIKPLNAKDEQIKPLRAQEVYIQPLRAQEVHLPAIPAPEAISLPLHASEIQPQPVSQI